MKKYYYIYEVSLNDKKFKYKAFSEHSAIQWVEEHLNRPEYKNSEFKIQPVYKN